MEDNSPLRFLNIDVSRHIYEKYYPNEENRLDKRMVNDQFNHYIREYPEISGMGGCCPWFICKLDTTRQKEWLDFYNGINRNFNYREMLIFLKEHKREISGY